MLKFLWLDDVEKGRPQVKHYQFRRLPFGLTLSPAILASTIRHHLSKYEESEPKIVSLLRDSFYSAAQICPNQNIRVMRISPIRVYVYAYTHIRVYIYAHTRIQHIRVWLIGMYELTYCFFFSYRSLLFSMA